MKKWGHPLTAGGVH